MNLKEILKKYGIDLCNHDGSLRNVVDVLEDLYLKTNINALNRMLFEISEEEMFANVFDNARGRNYKGVE